MVIASAALKTFRPRRGSSSLEFLRMVNASKHSNGGSGWCRTWLRRPLVVDGLGNGAVRIRNGDSGRDLLRYVDSGVPKVVDHVDVTFQSGSIRGRDRQSRTTWTAATFYTVAFRITTGSCSKAIAILYEHCYHVPRVWNRELWLGLIELMAFRKIVQIFPADLSFDDYGLVWNGSALELLFENQIQDCHYDRFTYFTNNSL